MRPRDIAQGALGASLNARWIDEELAQAAWVSSFLYFLIYLTNQKVTSFVRSLRPS